MKCRSVASRSQPGLFTNYMWPYVKLESNFLIHVDGSYFGEKEKSAGWARIFVLTLTKLWILQTYSAPRVQTSCHL